MTTKAKKETTTHLIEDPAERSRFQNAATAKIRVCDAEIMVLRAEIKKQQLERSANLSDIKSHCGLDHEIVVQGMSTIDLPEAERLSKFAQLRQFYEAAGFGEQVSFLPALTPARAPDQALDASKVQVAQAAGFQAGMQGKPATDNPYLGVSTEGVAWSASFGRAQEQIARDMTPTPSHVHE